jgi:hypothetical protein
VEGQLDVPLRHAGWVLVEQKVDRLGGKEEGSRGCGPQEAVAELVVSLGEVESV